MTVGPIELARLLVEQAGVLVWPLVVVLAEVVDQAMAELDRAQPARMSKLGDELGRASELRREAGRFRAEARIREWLASRTARWLQDTADGGLMARQPRRGWSAGPPKTFNAEGVM